MSIAETAKHDLAIFHPESGIATFLARAVRWVAAWHAERSAVRNLSHFSDAMLKDIGVTRGEIPDLVRHGRSEILRPQVVIFRE